MLHCASGLIGLTIGALDGQVGIVADVLFDDLAWKVRYFAVTTGNWLNGRTVLVSPECISSAHVRRGVLISPLSRAQIEASPLLETHLPMTRHYEAQLSDYYGIPYYWDAMSPGIGAFPMHLRGLDLPVTEVPPLADTAALPHEAHEIHLRSCKDTHGYKLDTNEGDVGQVGDFLIEERGWNVCFIVADTSMWWPGRRVLIDPRWAQDDNWENEAIPLDLERWMVKDAPSFDPEAMASETYKRAVASYYDALANRCDRPESLNSPALGNDQRSTV